MRTKQGVAAAVLSQPADTLLRCVLSLTHALHRPLTCSLEPRSRINKGEGGKGSASVKLVRLAKEAGPLGLFAGLGPRIVRLRLAYLQ